MSFTEQNGIEDRRRTTSCGRCITIICWAHTRCRGISALLLYFTGCHGWPSKVAAASANFQLYYSTCCSPLSIILRICKHRVPPVYVSECTCSIIVLLLLAPQLFFLDVYWSLGWSQKCAPSSPANGSDVVQLPCKAKSILHRFLHFCESQSVHQLHAV